MHVMLKILVDLPLHHLIVFFFSSKIIMKYKNILIFFIFLYPLAPIKSYF